ncbi:unnamed protein product [Clavelina lepadiformis]|uniref:F-box domain-containing protein n=1 Tax=Clavelina lepadiformis TaxID=159417 RepID=A0ABP0FCG3_CLALP
MADSASDRLSRECAGDVNWMKLPPELWLEIFSYLSPVTILNVVAFVCRKFKSLSFHHSLWKEIDVINWVEPIINLDSFIENLSSVIELNSEHLRSLTFSEITGNLVFGSDKRWLFYKFSNIVNLELPDCDYVTAQILEEIRKNCTKIETLILSLCSNVDNEAMEVVSKFEHLQILNISECHQVTDKGVNFIADMPCQILQFLSYDVQQFTDRSIVNLVSKQINIESLVLSGVNLTDYSVIHACLHLANLKTFYIYNCKNLTDRSIYALCGKIRLECLCLQRARNVSRLAINHLFQEKPLVNLWDLSISYTDAVLDETVDAISSGCPHLESIDLNICRKVTDESIDKLIKSCRKLEVVCLNGLTNLEGDWLAEIDHYLPKLHFLGIAFCSGISDDKIKHVLMRKPDLAVFGNKMTFDEFKQGGDTSCFMKKFTLEDFE